MASNLSSLGFLFDDAEAFQAKMIELAGKSLERIPCESGDYSVWRSRTGAEIWFHVPMIGTEDDANDIAGLTPFYEGLGAIDVTVQVRHKNHDDNAFEGSLTAEIADIDGMGYPLTFNAVDFAAHASRDLPFKATARIVCFARELRAFPSVEAFQADKSGALGEIALASQAFIPIGHFTEKEDCGETAPEATALMTGRVVECRRHTNEATGHDFHWLLIDSLAATFDIVADPDIVTGEIVEDGIVVVSGILFGRLMSTIVET